MVPLQRYRHFNQVSSYWESLSSCWCKLNSWIRESNCSDVIVSLKIFTNFILEEGNSCIFSSNFWQKTSINSESIFCSSCKMLIKSPKHSITVYWCPLKFFLCIKNLADTNIFKTKHRLHQLFGEQRMKNWRNVSRQLKITLIAVTLMRLPRSWQKGKMKNATRLNI